MKFAIFGNCHQAKKCEKINELFAALREWNDTYAIEQNYYRFLLDNGIATGENIEIIDSSDFNADIAISYGGDGTLLRTASKVGNKGIPILGINGGRLGFLTTISNEDISQTIRNIHLDEYEIEERNLIELKAEGTTLSNYPFALNEIAIMKHDSSAMMTLEATLNGSDCITYQADGLIVSAPSGSTGYSLSVGGPIIAPDASVMVLTPIASHSLNARPIVVNDSTTVRIKANSRSHNFLIAIDGRNESCNEDVILTIKKAPYKQRIIRSKGTSFIKSLREKLMLGADTRR